MADPAPNVPVAIPSRNVLDSVPGLRQIIMLVAIAGAIAAAILLVLWARGSDYSMLYGNLAERETAEVIDALTSAGIPYKMEGGAVLVPSDKVHDARIKLAAQGLPQSSSLGIELLEKDQGFGTSQFVEKARYQHALETELARTIVNVQGVQNARVHLALPPPSVFVRDRKEASASVMLQLYPGRRLDPGQTAAIVHLVASSVPDLSANQVTVIDQNGTLLNSPESNSDIAVTAKQFEYTRQLEQSYAQRVEDLLEPLTGPNRVRARVTADMDFARTDEAREQYEPQTVVRSEQTATDQRMAGDGAQGIPGALSNQPPGTAGAPPAAQQQQAAAGTGAGGTAQQPVSTSNRSTRNYEIDRTVSYTRGQGNALKKLSVAVVVDNWQRTDDSGEVTSTPLTPEEIERMTTLVKEAIGFNESRGDRVSVVNTPFHTEPPLEEAEAPGLLSQPWVKSVLKQGVAVVLVLLLAFVVLKPIMTSLTQPARGGTATLSPDQLMLGGGGGGMYAGNYDQQVAAARGMVGQDPKRAAAVMKEWVNG